MPDRAMGFVPDLSTEEYGKRVDPNLAFKDDQLKQCGDAPPIGRGEPTYSDRNEVRALPRMEPPLEARMAKQEAVIQAIQNGSVGSLKCQGDPNCHEPFSPPVDIPFGDILAEEFCDAPPES